MQVVWLKRNPLLTAVVVAFGIWVLLQILERALWVMVALLVATILAAALGPIVRLLRRVQLPPGGWRIPKALAVLLIYLVLALIVGALGFFAGRPLASELTSLIESLPEQSAALMAQVDALGEQIGFPDLVPSSENVAQEVQAQLSDVVTGAGRTMAHVVEILFRAILVLLITIFLVAESERILSFWVGLFPPDRRDQVQQLTSDIGAKMGYWVLGQLAVATIIGVLGGIVWAILGLPYPLLAGIATALLDLAPVVGVILMALPAFLFGLTESPLVAVLAALIFIGLAELDGDVLSPLITGRAVKLSPVLVIIAVPFGLAIYGPVGALISIPVTAALQVITTQVVVPWLRNQQGLASEKRPEESGAEAG